MKAAIIAYHGTGRIAFARFDVAAAAPHNVGLPFGIRAAALSQLDAIDSTFKRN